jgi:outer membrane lipase/esterase
MTVHSPRRPLAVAWATLAVAVTTACGGGGSDGAAAPAPAAAPSTPPVATAVAVSRVIVAGDSLADVGTFGLKATVQSAANPARGYPIYPELVAASFGLGSPCNAFSSTDQIRFTSNAGCTDFAVAGAQVVNPVTRGGSSLPFSLQDQLEKAVSVNGGAWRPGDLVLVDAGSNDAAGVADAYLGARNGGADAAVYVALLAQQLSASAISDALGQADGGSVAANLYMQSVAQTLWNTVKANTLDKGATRVALVEVPDLTLTPRFSNIAAGLATSEGAAQATAFQVALRRWITTFNAELARQVAGDARVALVPYFSDFTAQQANPSAYGLSNVTDPSCPPAGDFPACTDAALDASPPQPGLAAGWWKTWFYSDSFHPSPRGHELLAASIGRALSQAGWR